MWELAWGFPIFANGNYVTFVDRVFVGNGGFSVCLRALPAALVGLEWLLTYILQFSFTSTFWNWLRDLSGSFSSVCMASRIVRQFQDPDEWMSSFVWAFDPSSIVANPVASDTRVLLFHTIDDSKSTTSTANSQHAYLSRMLPCLWPWNGPPKLRFVSLERGTAVRWLDNLMATKSSWVEIEGSKAPWVGDGSLWILREGVVTCVRFWVALGRWRVCKRLLCCLEWWRRRG